MPQISKHEENMLNIQTQMRQNQTEYASYIADLDNWEGDIKQKEENLKSDSSGGEKTSNLPPVRNTIHKKKLKKKKKEKPASLDSKPKKISGFDFKAWDKFDVDKALEEVDEQEDKKETSSSEYETDEEWELERKTHLAGQEKDKGNEYLKKGEYDNAVEAYSRGMEFDPTNAILPANRAMALLKQQKFAAAELDCTTSISLDPMYVKAYLRRATSRSGLGKLEESVADFNRVLDLEPTNKQAKTEIERMQKELKRSGEEPVTTTLTDNEQGRVMPIYKPPDERSKKPLFRVPIEEIGIETAARPAPSDDQSELSKRITAKEKEEFDKMFVSSSGEVPSAKGDAVSNGSQIVSEKKSLISEIVDIVPASPPKTAQLSKPQISEDKLNELSSRTPSVGSSKTSQSQSTSSLSLSSDVQTSSSNGLEISNGFSVPQTSFQFQADFKQLKRNHESFFHYLQAISPESYPTLFGQSLDADILTTILKAIALHPDKIDLYKTLHSLTTVKRFSMTAMFLSKKEKQVARDLMDVLEKSEQHSDSEIKSLKKSYDL